MSTPPTLPPDPRLAIDANHLNLLAIFHFVLAGLSLLGIGFLYLHWRFLSLMMGNPEMWENQQGGPPPGQFLEIFKWFYVFMGACIVLACVGNLLSGVFIKKRRHRVFSLVVAGVDCMAFPFGTVLGTFTFIVLLRDSVRDAYAANARLT